MFIELLHSTNLSLQHKNIHRDCMGIEKVILIETETWVNDNNQTELLKTESTGRRGEVELKVSHHLDESEEGCKSFIFRWPLSSLLSWGGQVGSVPSCPHTRDLWVYKLCSCNYLGVNKVKFVTVVPVLGILAVSDYIITLFTKHHESTK